MKNLRIIAAVLTVLLLAGPAGLAAMAGACAGASSPDCCCRVAVEPSAPAVPSCHAAPEPAPEPEPSVCDCGPAHGESGVPAELPRSVAADGFGVEPAESGLDLESVSDPRMATDVSAASLSAAPTYLIHCSIRC